MKHHKKVYSISNGKYIINSKKVLGTGVFSTVFLGKCTTDTTKLPKNTLVAIKKMKKTDKISTKVIEAELLIIYFLMDRPHPNIIKYYDIINDDNDTDAVYIVMEYCKNGTLKSLIDSPTQSITENKRLKSYFYQLCQGVKFLHKYNILHRDIKPDNILLTDDFKTLKIVDFGLAKLIVDNQLNQTVCGSPLYMSPELAQHKTYNFRSDIWSMGMVLYEMLFGFNPFQHCHTIEEMIVCMKTQEIEIPEKLLNKNIDNKVISLLYRILEKQQQKRITLTSILNHPWMMKLNVIPVPMQVATRPRGLSTLSTLVKKLPKKKKKLHRLPQHKIIANYTDLPTSFNKIDFNPILHKKIYKKDVVLLSEYINEYEDSV